MRGLPCGEEAVLEADFHWYPGKHPQSIRLDVIWCHELVLSVLALWCTLLLVHFHSPGWYSGCDAKGQPEVLPKQIQTVCPNWGVLTVRLKGRGWIRVLYWASGYLPVNFGRRQFPSEMSLCISANSCKFSTNSLFWDGQWDNFSWHAASALQYFVDLDRTVAETRNLAWKCASGIALVWRGANFAITWATFWALCADQIALAVSPCSF